MAFKRQNLHTMNLKAVFYIALTIVAVTAILTFTITLSGSDDEFPEISKGKCSCAYSGKRYDFCYRPPANATVSGIPFNCEHARYLDKLGLLNDKSAINLESQELPEPVFVTAFSQNHYKEGLTLIANIRKFWPQKKLYIYDLGLSERSSDILKRMCMQELRRFPFEDYPTYVKNLGEYRWKPLVIAEVLNEFGAVWYMDTSVRWKEDKLDVVYRELQCRGNRTRRTDTNLHGSVMARCRKSSYLLHSPVSHGVYAATHPGMYKFIPTQIEQLKKSETYAAGFVFAVKTTYTQQILKWYVLCALEKKCMAPRGARIYCKFKNDRYRKYANCHRYDQSAINLLLANANGYNTENYVTSIEKDGAVIIDRRADSKLSEKDILCDKTSTL